MKAGVAMAFTAIEMLTEAGPLEREIVLLLNSDERWAAPSPAHHRTTGSRVRRRLRTGAGAGAGLQNRPQGNRQLAD